MFRSSAFSGGVHPRSNKNTESCQTLLLDTFKTIRMPMLLHNGAPSVCLVKAGDKVEIGQLIGRADSPMAVPIHASVSGTVRSVGEEVASNGQLNTVVTIDSDGLGTIHPDIRPPLIESRADFIKAIRESGLVGLGGAGFPTYLKLQPPAGKEPDTLVINAAECEPYVTSDNRLCLEHPEEIIRGIRQVMKQMAIPRALIGIEKNKPQAIKAMRQAIDQLQPSDIQLVVLPTLYPQGAEKMLIYALTGRTIPSGGLPHDVKVMVLNVSTARFINNYLLTGLPLVRRVITLDGGAVKTPGNYDVPVGVPVTDLIEAAGGLIKTVGKVLMGGPMMGISVDRLDVSILKINNAILVFDEIEAQTPQESACIRCARCIEVCPINLMPTTLDSLAREKDVAGLQADHVADCIECGCCTYVCPAKRYLVQSIRNGKAEVRAAKAKEAVRS